MTQIERIKAKIEELRDYQISCIKNDYRLTGKPEENIILECNKLLSFINSLQAEPVSEDLEKELSNQMNSIYPLPEEDDFDDPCYSVSNAIRSQRIGFKKGFKIGANWQKEQFEKRTSAAVLKKNDA